MGCGVSTFYCMDDDVGLSKSQFSPGNSEDPRQTKVSGVSRQTMVSNDSAETSSSDSSSTGFQSKVICITMHVPKEIEKPGEEKSLTKYEERRNGIVEDTASKDDNEDVNKDRESADNEEEDEPWWRKGDTGFMKSPSFRDYCIIHYSSDDDEYENENERIERTSNEKKLQGKENTKAPDSNKKKSRGKIGKSRPKEKRVLGKEGSGSLRNFLNVAACYSQTHSSKSTP